MSMYKIETHDRQVKIVVCDRCGKRMSEDEPFDGYNNRTQIRFRAGYASLFGDSNKVEGDLCDSASTNCSVPTCALSSPIRSNRMLTTLIQLRRLESSSTCRRGGCMRLIRLRTQWRKTSHWSCANGSIRVSI